MDTNESKGKWCDYNNFKRVRYFHGMLMSDRDFTEEQIYHIEKRKLLNKMLHGWGIVCGFDLKAASPESSEIIITPGMALDCKGNEIYLDRELKINLEEETYCTGDTSRSDDPCA
ncbi:hypothetical protein ACSAZK_03660 [Methanosarcina sp. Mfa9]|uniref:hypothetical protein n=1 Tax=Methanosarcina sp. Mfa9 TaxID=3439063 RepID=UPI003F843B24